MGLEFGDDQYVLGIFFAAAEPEGQRPGDIMFYMTCQVEPNGQPQGEVTWTLEGRLRRYYDSKAFHSRDTKDWVSYALPSCTVELAEALFKQTMTAIATEYNEKPLHQFKHEFLMIKASGDEAANIFREYTEKNEGGFLHMKVMLPDEALREGYINQDEYDRQVAAIAKKKEKGDG